MDEIMAKQLAEKAASIAKETAERLKIFSKDTALLFYAYRMQGSAAKMNFPEGTAHKKGNNKEADKKLEKMMEDARLKWKYAPDADKKKAMQMDKIILDSDEKIRAVYQNIV
ncbi:MAG: hypothetical protein V4722_11255 [Bacteroidota bacterium]